MGLAKPTDDHERFSVTNSRCRYGDERLVAVSRVASSVKTGRAVAWARLLGDLLCWLPRCLVALHLTGQLASVA